MSQYCYQYPRPSVTTDCIIFGFDNEELKVLLIERGIEPYKGQWAFPGGFLQMNEDAETGARRELAEETGIADLFVEQLYTFSTVNRDPRGRVITIAYYALIKLDNYTVKAGDDARNAAWYPVRQIPPLAFDHEAVLKVALQRLQNKIRYQPVGFELLPEKFTLSQLQNLYETVLECKLDKRNFRKKIQKFDFLVKLDEKATGGQYRAANLYKFDKQKYEAKQKAGFNFEL